MLLAHSNTWQRHCDIQYSSRVFCLLPRTTAMSGRVAERGGHGETSFSTQTRGTPRFTTAIFHPSPWSWLPMNIPPAEPRCPPQIAVNTAFCKNSVDKRNLCTLAYLIIYIFICISGLKNKRIKTSAY